MSGLKNAYSINSIANRQNYDTTLHIEQVIQ